MRPTVSPPPEPPAHDHGLPPVATPVLPGPIAVPPELRERFIPVRPSDLTRLLLAEPGLSDEQRGLLDQLHRMLGAVLHHEFFARLEELNDLYAPLDPDSDCVVLREHTLARTQRADETFLEPFVAVLERANFRKLDLAEIQAAVEAPNELGLNYVPNFDLFEHLVVYVRGHAVVTRVVRDFRSWFRKRPVIFPAYQRMVVILKFREGIELGPFARSDVLYLRLFKDVPRVDMEMHLPEQGTRVRMRKIDKAQIASPWFVGLSTVASKVLLNFALSPLAVGTIMFAPISAGINSFFGFQRAKQKHLHHMIRHLYYLTLANNASVISRLIAVAEEEEYKEALLAYFFLLRREGEPCERAALDAQIEAFLRSRTDTLPNFEIDDALDKLIRLGIIRPEGPSSYSAAPLDEALRHLDRRWDALYRYANPENPGVPPKTDCSPATAQSE